MERVHGATTFGTSLSDTAVALLSVAVEGATNLRNAIAATICLLGDVSLRAAVSALPGSLASSLLPPTGAFLLRGESNTGVRATLIVNGWTGFWVSCALLPLLEVLGVACEATPLCHSQGRRLLVALQARLEMLRRAIDRPPRADSESLQLCSCVHRFEWRSLGRAESVVPRRPSEATRCRGRACELVVLTTSPSGVKV